MATPSEKPSKPKISLIRKILVWCFIVGFWVFYYWSQESVEPPPQPKDPKEIAIDEKK